MNNTLKFKTQYVEDILQRDRIITTGLFNEENLSVGDIVDLINFDTKEKFATGKVTGVRRASFEEMAKDSIDRPGIYDQYLDFYGKEIEPGDEVEWIDLEITEKGNLLDQAIHLRHAGKDEEAKAIFLQLLQEGKDLARASYYLGLISIDENDKDQAKNYYTKAIEVNPGYYQAHNNLGLLFLSEKDYAAAVECFCKAHGLAPNDVHPLINLALAHFQKGDYASALRYYEEVHLDDLPSNLYESILIKLADCYLQTSNIEKAIELYLKIFSLYPNNVWAANQIGFIYLEIKHDLAKATEWTDKALEINPDFRAAVQNKGLIFKSLGKYNEAVEYLKKAIKLEPENFQGHYNLACTYALMGEESNIQAPLKKALQLAPFLKDHLGKDQDFQNYRNTKWLEEIQ